MSNLDRAARIAAEAIAQSLREPDLCALLTIADGREEEFIQRAQAKIANAMDDLLADEVADERAAERERIRLLVEAVRDASAAAQGDTGRVVYVPDVERAWEMLLDALKMMER